LVILLLLGCPVVL
jgi:hypothetical protein